MFLILIVSSLLVSTSKAALNLALHSGHSNIPMDILVSPPSPDGLRAVKGHVLTGVDTSVPHFGHLTNS
jgi:hypothetical protein